MNVGIRELRAKLSHYIERAAAGEVLHVTRRGIPVAVLTPLGMNRRIADGEREGWIRRPARGLPQAVSPVKAPPGPTTDEILAADRGRAS